MSVTSSCRLVLTAVILLSQPFLDARAGDLSTSMYSLLPSNVSGSSRVLPGEIRESRLSAERSLIMSPGFQWLTTTDLSRTRGEQPFPVRAQSMSLSTGPRVRLGNTELALPFNAGRDAGNLNAESTWTGGAPRMTVALGPNDRVRLEARLSSRNDSLSIRRKRSATVSWRHQFNERWSLTTGVRQESESDVMEMTTTNSADTFASMDALLPGGWRWSLVSELSNASYGTVTPADPSRRDRSASLALSTRHPLYGGWWISGELKAKQTWNDAETPVANQSGGLKLFRNF